MYEGALAFDVERIDLVGASGRPRTQIMLNVGNPDEAFALSFIPNDGVGLARIEFIITSAIGIHPMALVRYAQLAGRGPRPTIDRADRRLRRQAGVLRRPARRRASRTIAAAFYPKDVIVRFSDFKTNEYAGLLGGMGFEPARGEPDDRLPRRLALLRRRATARASRSSAGRSSGSATRWA